MDKPESEHSRGTLSWGTGCGEGENVVRFTSRSLIRFPQQVSEKKSLRVFTGA